jgi:telomerase Cajal body protein 1
MECLETTALEAIDAAENVPDVVFETPKLFERRSLVELCRSSWHPTPGAQSHQTYLRGCKWSPDGTCCLTVINNGGVHLIELPRDLYQEDSVDVSRPVNILDSVVQVSECGLIYDFCWYPGMNSTIPDTCWYVTIHISSFNIY